MVTGIEATPTTQNASPTAATGKKNLGKDDFMKLLLAQLKNQDPTSPMDAKDFSAQMAQFTSVEQMLNVNQNLQKLQDGQTALNTANAVNLIGKTIDSPGNSINLVKNQAQTLNYSLLKDASLVSIDIFDPSGQKVTTLTEGSKSADKNHATWSGIDGNGNQMESGKYTFSVKAIDTDGNAMEASTYASGLVSDVVFEGGKSYAIVNGNKIPASEISRVGLN